MDMGGIPNFISNTVTLQMKQNCQPRSEAKKKLKIIYVREDELLTSKNNNIEEIVAPNVDDLN